MRAGHRTRRSRARASLEQHAFEWQPEFCAITCLPPWLSTRARRSTAEDTCVRCEAEDGFVECDVGIADGELGGVNADGKSAGTGVEIVADEGALVGFVPAAAGGERERKGGDELAGAEVGAEGGGEHGGDGRQETGEAGGNQ